MCHAIHFYLVRVGSWGYVFPLKSSDYGFRKSGSPRQWDMVRAFTPLTYVFRNLFRSLYVCLWTIIKPARPPFQLLVFRHQSRSMWVEQFPIAAQVEWRLPGTHGICCSKVIFILYMLSCSWTALIASFFTQRIHERSSGPFLCILYFLDVIFSISLPKEQALVGIESDWIFGSGALL